MYTLSAQNIVRIWEIGEEQHPVDQALLILFVALPDYSHDELLALSIGQRNQQLLHVRAHTFGQKLASFAICPACQQKLEFTLDVASLQQGASTERGEQMQQVTLDGYSLQFRLPDSRDLASIATQHDLKAARTMLAQRCIVASHLGDETVAAERLPETLIELLAGHIAKSDPQAEMLLDLTCPACSHQWELSFDIISFFWAEICSEAKRLLREVHILARAYGWQESDILSMSTTRRQCYLEMVN